MKFFFFSLLFAILAACAFGDEPQKSVLISAESPGIIDHVTQWIEDKVRRGLNAKVLTTDIRVQEGVVLHRYNLINAVLAKAPGNLFEEAKNTFTTNNWGTLVVEEDQEVHAWGDGN
ncbi:hypothetical protein MPH_03032 [Macrophomina phaseolina MS6]|uniref:Uncharacterized protein n=1 Tax=Macrophomina phaseolina (strain MS6) TaxID=1126212 RepID=K2SBD9_MACPH|nr:hypothetical protein MPH_03032 [Macrophomina phaseolina MS6]